MTASVRRPTRRPTPLSARFSRTCRIACVIAVAGCAGGTVPDSTDDALHRIRVAEDARQASDPALAPILEGLRHADPRVRQTAARALGRFENPDLIEALRTVLSDAEATVRVAAVNGVGQSGHVTGWEEAWAALEEGLAAERDPVVRAVYGQTLGRLPFDEPEAHARAERLLVDLLNETADALSGSAADARALALARGFESLARRGATLRSLEPPTLEALAVLTDYGRGSTTAASVVGAARVRATALAAMLAGATAGQVESIRTGLSDPDDEVRRVAAKGLAGVAEPNALLARALVDPSPRVRWEAVRISGAQRDRLGCRPLLEAVDDADPHVAILALDQLGTPCREATEQLRVLSEAGAAAPGSEARWQPWAHAVASLASIAPQEAGDAVSRLSRHPSPFARAWAARAAASMPDARVLHRLMDDEHHNVRQSALEGLSGLEGHAVDSVAIQQLAAEDPQLVRTAAAALEGTPTPAAAVPALIRSLDRFTATGRENSRDARLALLERLGELGTRENASAVRPLLQDFDPRVAELAAEILGTWTGEEAVPSPHPHPSAPVPDPATLDRLSRSSVVLELARGGEIEIRLFPYVAPTNAGRFARLAEAGYFDGLTFHRIAANFVIQGGSPGANEYWGAAAFSRDELALLGNWRGTVGLSTRGRDTGDAQIYVNLVDNLRLDHDYTVFGEVVRGMEWVDGALEGETIARAIVVEPAG